MQLAPIAPRAQRRAIQTPVDPLLTLPELRAELGISAPTAWRWRSLGRIPAPVDLPGRPRWRKSTIEALKGAVTSTPIDDGI